MLLSLIRVGSLATVRLPDRGAHPEHEHPMHEHPVKRLLAEPIRFDLEAEVARALHSAAV
jgi:hypothetical protein